MNELAIVLTRTTFMNIIIVRLLYKGELILIVISVVFLNTKYYCCTRMSVQHKNARVKTEALEGYSKPLQHECFEAFCCFESTEGLLVLDQSLDQNMFQKARSVVRYRVCSEGTVPGDP